MTAQGTLDADVLVVGEKIAAVLARGEATDAATYAAASAAIDAADGRQQARTWSSTPPGST